MENQGFNFTPDIPLFARNSFQAMEGGFNQTTINPLVQTYLSSDFQTQNVFYPYGRSGGGGGEETPPLLPSQSLQQNLNSLAISLPPPIYPSEALLANYAAANYRDEALGSGSGSGGGTVITGGQWDPRHGDDGGWIPSKSSFNNELSLTLATSSDHSELDDLSLSSGGSGRPAAQSSQVIFGSSYLGAVQEILLQIASLTLENVDYGGAGSSSPCTWSSPEEIAVCSVDSSSDQRRKAAETKKAKLLALLQMVDERYNQCVDEIHTVVSAFHAATELDPQLHSRFALRTISGLYNGLRERISRQCLAIGASLETEGSDRIFENDFIQKQWALQQLKKKDHQLWRPQRGLPEKSVSVLRAWMFQNFLHPYPKDAEKHLLAIRSGLTRNQVSNWFINARVRLWKPMIEEMYAEMNRRKTRRNENNESNQRSLFSITNNIQRLD